MDKQLNIRVEDNKVTIDGYVNAVERKSKLLNSRIGKFYEKIRAGAFANALKNNNDVKLFLNHDSSVEYATTKDKSLELEEDAIGLKAHLESENPDIVERAKNGDLIGWSFGFYDVEGGYELSYDTESYYPTRTVNELELFEVSLLDRAFTPAYAGTLVTVRNKDDEALNIGGEIDEMTENDQANSSEKETNDQVEGGETNEPKTAEKEPETPKEKVTDNQDKPQESVETNSFDLSLYKEAIARWEKE